MVFFLEESFSYITYIIINICAIIHSYHYYICMFCFMFVILYYIYELNILVPDVCQFW